MIVWYEHLYMGAKAKRSRSAIIEDIREKKPHPDVYVITPPSNEKNVLDIYPTATVLQDYYENRKLLVIGIAKGYQEALKLAASIVDEMYRKTGNFRIREYIGTEGPEEREK